MQKRAIRRGARVVESVREHAANRREDMAIKLIAIDLDGTLLDGGGRVSERNRRALMAAEARGALVVLASGRSSRIVWGYAREAGLERSPVISNNGPRVQGPDGATLAEECLEPEVAREVMRRWDGMGLMYTLYSGDDMYYSYRPPNYSEYAEAADGPGAPRCILDADARYRDGAAHAHKLVCFDGDAARLARARALLGDLGDALEVNSSWWNNVEVMRRGVDKGWALRRLRGIYGLAREEVMAFGDNDNDREMLREAGWPVAMANGSDALKRIARIVAPDCNDSGVGRVVEEYVLGERT